MARFLEIVLDVAASGAPPASGRRRRPPSFAASLAAALPQLGQPSPSAVRVDAVTFDCAGNLAAAGWRVGVETRGRARQVTVSRRVPRTPGITEDTAVFEAPLDDADFANARFDAAPVQFREALAAAGAMAPAAAVTCARSTWRWARDGIEAELVLDADVRVPDEEGPVLHELRVRAPWPEGGDAAPVVNVLFACAGDLIDAVPAFVRLDDVLHRATQGGLAGSAVAVRAASVDLGGAQTAQAALVAIARNISAQWFRNETGARDSPSIEFIHQMRVAQRRLRTAMKIFSPWQDETWKTHIDPELTWLRGLLGDARDRDVFVESTLPMLAAADVDAANWSTLVDEANAQRLEARSRVSEALASRRYARVALAWLQWLAMLAERDGHDGHDGTSARTVRRHAKKCVGRYYRRLSSTPKLTAVDPARRHRVRIDAKYLRYTLEFFAPITSRRTRTDTVRVLSRLQTVLGDGNDATVALRYLEKLDVEPYQLGFARGWCEAVKRSTAREGERLLRELHPPKIPGDN